MFSPACRYEAKERALSCGIRHAVALTGQGGPSAQDGRGGSQRERGDAGLSRPHSSFAGQGTGEKAGKGRENPPACGVGFPFP